MFAYERPVADSDRRPARPAAPAGGAAAHPPSREQVLRLQRAVGNAAASALVEMERSPVLDVLGSSGGRPLDSDVRDDMEARLGHSFGDVRVHDDAAADASARSVQAAAYTVGSDVVFRSGRYDPASDAGRVLLAHELTHVVQQRNGPVDGAAAAGGIRVSDPGDRFEREATAVAERALAEPAAAAQRHTDEQETG